MKKLMIAAAVAAMTASGGAWAACSADIDMGGNKITNATMSALSTSSEVATKAYVDAATSLVETSSVSSSAVKGLAGANQYCADLDSAGTAADGTASNAGWRVPNASEATTAFVISGAASVPTATITNSPSYLSTSVTTAPTHDSTIWTSEVAVDHKGWFKVKLNGGSPEDWDGTLDQFHAVCVR